MYQWVECSSISISVLKYWRKRGVLFCFFDCLLCTPSCGKHSLHPIHQMEKLLLTHFNCKQKEFKSFTQFDPKSNAGTSVNVLLATTWFLQHLVILHLGQKWLDPDILIRRGLSQACSWALRQGSRFMAMESGMSILLKNPLIPKSFVQLQLILSETWEAKVKTRTFEQGKQKKQCETIKAFYKTGHIHNLSKGKQRWGRKHGCFMQKTGSFVDSTMEIPYLKNDSLANVHKMH